MILEIYSKYKSHYLGQHTTIKQHKHLFSNKEYKTTINNSLRRTDSTMSTLRCAVGNVSAAQFSTPGNSFVKFRQQAVTRCSNDSAASPSSGTANYLQ